jgi:hypothetical protein
MVKKVIKHKTVRHKKDGVGVVKSTLHKTPVASLPRYKCKNPKCRHEWLPRTNRPIVCPHCHTPWSA